MVKLKSTVEYRVKGINSIISGENPSLYCTVTGILVRDININKTTVCGGGEHIQQRMDQPGMVASPGQLNRGNDIFPVSSRSRLGIGLVRRVRPSRPVPSRPASAHSKLQLALTIHSG